MEYQKKFEEAVERTKRLNLNIPMDINFVDTKYLSNELMVKFPYALRDKFGEIGIEELAGQCLSINLRIKNFISDFFKSPVYYTIGYVVIKDKNYFYQNEESLNDMLKNGVNSDKISIHAWLTLPSMEIIDLSIATSCAIVNNIPEGLGGIIINFADNIKDTEFIPMLVGEDFVFKAGLFRGFVISQFIYGN